MGFRLMRSVRWDILGEFSPGENGKTQLARFPADFITALNALIANKEFQTRP